MDRSKNGLPDQSNVFLTSPYKGSMVKKVTPSILYYLHPLIMDSMFMLAICCKMDLAGFPVAKAVNWIIPK